ncbi:2,3,4,5-tetrahydropyridine-2,6-dicarboxylate N-acetyltransferase [Rubripirellula tenax]|uniref:2,3,4,5-tetrahydropyridine-2,6-dicarboxylate N-acetyltransferase n=1 Tax=Rubripirellula tenax TaxID=2528015 RepID=A0A5C6FG41_9BACT|nr:gamma carbonic anhydrase family protein [Rubripirellula tenax]TWU60501.1 2,3,4,5-tetrahydropyridine-2,6-dicarboxylate N-acetyltransferase [Rubripirellula tenax]
MIDATFHPERVHKSVFIAKNATVIGDVTAGSGASIWFGAVVRGDTESVVIGERSNVQDLCVLHADPEYPCVIGDDVTIGHAAVVHGATIGDGAMIGIRAVVLNGAKVGAGAIVGAGAVVTEGMEIPPGHLAVGVPAKVIRELTPANIARAKHAADHYVAAANAYRNQSTTPS